MRVLITACLLLPAAAAGPLNAQTGQKYSSELPQWFRTEAPAARAQNSAPWYSRLLSAAGAAALGAGVGFFASQVFTGDWDEEPGTAQVDRPAWAAVGGSIGFAVGFSFPIRGHGSKPQLGRGIKGGRLTISADEFKRTGVNTAHDAVRLLRPEWLITRGVHIIGESRQETIEVYLDDVRLGGVDFLRDVNAQTIASIHYLDAAAATYRWGAGHSHGVILIIARGGNTGSN